MEDTDFKGHVFSEFKERTLKNNFGGEEALRFIKDEIDGCGYRFSEFTAAQIKAVVYPTFVAAQDMRVPPWWQRETIGYGDHGEYFYWVCTLTLDNLPRSFLRAGIRKIHFLRDAIKVILNTDLAESHEKIAKKMGKYFPGFTMVPHKHFWKAKENHVYMFSGSDLINRRDPLGAKDLRCFLYHLSYKLREEDSSDKKVMTPLVRNMEHAIHLLEAKFDLFKY